MLKHFIPITSYCLLTIILYGCWRKNNEDYKEQMLIEINKQRLAGCFCGEDSMPPVRELIYDEMLESAARRHVLDMTENDIFRHIGSDGSTPQIRAAESGFTGAYIGENIARGFVSVNEVMTRWLSSIDHCRTIMDSRFHYVGVAYEDYYWVQVFGSD